MKKLITLTLLAFAVASAHAGPLNVGGYFTINIPKTWRAKPSGQPLHGDGTYRLFLAESYSCVMTIHIVNPPWSEGTITLAAYSNMTEADLPEMAVYNQRVGMSVPVVKKDQINGIPVLFFRQKDNKVRLLEMDMWINDKIFVIKFLYTMEAVQTINAIIDSIRPDKNLEVLDCAGASI